MLDVGPQGVENLDREAVGGRYFKVLREDDKWVNMIVHEMICRQEKDPAQKAL